MPNEPGGTKEPNEAVEAEQLDDKQPSDAEVPTAVEDAQPVQAEPPAEQAVPVIAVVAPGGDGPPEPPQPQPSLPGPGPGGTPVSARGIATLVALYFGVSVLCIYSMLTFWPTEAGRTTAATTTAATTTTALQSETEATPAPDEEAEPDSRAQEAQPVEPPPKSTSFLWLGPRVFDIEILFFLIVACAGALGGSVAAIRSLGIYVGSRSLTRSWIPFYIFKPLLGALLATVMYLLLRAGLFSPSASNAQVSPYGFAAIGALVGLFSEQASEKLKRVAEELFTKPYDRPPPDHYADSTPQEEQRPQ
jgi:hypothetical protein